MDNQRKKEMINAYKEKPVIGAVYYIVCSGNEKKWLRSTTDLQGTKNRFQFAVNINSAPEPSLQNEFKEYGIGSFSLVVLEELTKKEDQSARDFSADIKMLYDIWQEKLESENK